MELIEGPRGAHWPLRRASLPTGVASGLRSSIREAIDHPPRHGVPYARDPKKNESMSRNNGGVPYEDTMPSDEALLEDNDIGLPRGAL